MSSSLATRGAPASLLPRPRSALLQSIPTQLRPRWFRSCSAAVVRAEAPVNAEHEAAAPAAAAPPTRLGWWEKDCPPNMKDVHSIQELVDELADAGDKLVIVEFYAPWCNACKALFPKLCRLMAEHQDDIVFLKVSFESNKETCKTMGVKVLPFFHFYRGAEGRVDTFSCTISKLQRFKDALEQHTSAFCSLWEIPGIEEFPDVHPHHHHHHPEAPEGMVTVADRPTDLKSVAWS